MYNNGGWQAKVTVEKNKTKKNARTLAPWFYKKQPERR